MLRTVALILVLIWVPSLMVAWLFPHRVLLGFVSTDIRLASVLTGIPMALGITWIWRKALGKET